MEKATVDLSEIAHRLEKLSLSENHNKLIIDPKILVQNRIDEVKRLLVVLTEVNESDEALRQLAVAYKLKKQLDFDLALLNDDDKTTRIQLEALQQRNSKLERDVKRLREKGKTLEEENADLKEQVQILNRLRDAAQNEKGSASGSESDDDEIETFNADVSEEPNEERSKSLDVTRARSASKVTVRVEKANPNKNFPSSPSVTLTSGSNRASSKSTDVRVSLDSRKDVPRKKKEKSLNASDVKKEPEKKKKEVSPTAKDHPDVFDKNTLQDIIDGLKMSIQSEAQVDVNSELQIADYKDSYQILIRRPGQDLLKFKFFAPKVFSKIRAISGVSVEHYLRSFQSENLKPVKGEGKSGAYFIFTKDKQFVLKTTTGEERDFLWANLPLYYQYVNRHRNTMLPRFYGVYSMKHDGIGGVTRFVIMNNVFNTPLEPIEKYDLKGSSVGRFVAPKYRKPGTILKDLDIKEMNRKLYLSDQVRRNFIKQLEKDCEFLSRNKVMDYSLLLGIYYETPDNKEKTQESLKSYLENPNIIPSLLQNNFQQYYGGIKAVRPDGVTEVYYIGIIDVLIQYANKKRFEHFLKRMAYDAEEVSVTAPPFYSERFFKFITSLLESPKEKEKDDDSSSQDDSSSSSV